MGRDLMDRLKAWFFGTLLVAVLPMFVRNFFYHLKPTGIAMVDMRDLCFVSLAFVVSSSSSALFEKLERSISVVAWTAVIAMLNGMCLSVYYWAETDHSIRIEFANVTTCALAVVSLIVNLFYTIKAKTI